MADRHLNLFYTYNRDNELIENNLTRAFIVFLSTVSGEVRHKILSTLLERSDETIGMSADAEGLDFKDSRFALQSNIDLRLSQNADRKALLTISTEPLDIPSSTLVADPDATGESEDDCDFPSVSTSRPDAWIYDEKGAYCILIEAKVGSYPLEIAQLQAHAGGWLNSCLQRLKSNNSLFSITWFDVLRTLRDVLNDQSPLDRSEERLLSHMMEFIGYYGYPMWDDFAFSDLTAPPDWVISDSPLPPESTTPSSGSLGLDFQRLSSPPDSMLMSRSPNPQKGRTR